MQTFNPTYLSVITASLLAILTIPNNSPITPGLPGGHVSPAQMYQPSRGAYTPLKSRSSAPAGNGSLIRGYPINQTGDFDVHFLPAGSNTGFSVAYARP